MGADERRKLPSVSRLLDETLVAAHGAARVTAAARAVLSEARDAATQGAAPALAALKERVRRRVEVRVTPVINATGVILHTNLGRAPWSLGAIEAAGAAAGYSTVELDLEDGSRGRRGRGVEDRLCALTGAEDALVVNNCAAAVTLVLTALAKDRQVLVSRGQLVEIGGGFRVPEILEASGARLHEVGTTNRTRVEDFRDAITDEVAAVLWVHHSNFKQIGFTASPSLDELCSLGLPVVADLGSGALSPQGEEPTVAEAMRAGVDILCFSGDKLLGGPQAGLIVGGSEWIDRLRRFPLYRALRLDKVMLAALEATLDDWLRDESVPVNRMMEAELPALRHAVDRLRSGLPQGVDHTLEEVDATIGGGSMPGRTLPSVALSIGDPRPEALYQALLAGTPPVVGRIHQGRLLLDMRTVEPLGETKALATALAAALTRLTTP